MTKSGPLSYRIRANDQIHRRHIDQLKKRAKRDVDKDSDDFVDFSSGQLLVTSELAELPAEVGDPEATEQSNAVSETTEVDSPESLEPEPVVTKRYELRANRSHPNWYSD